MKIKKTTIFRDLQSAQSKSESEYHYKMGKASGYSDCCMTWFKWRHKFISTFPRAFRVYWTNKHSLAKFLGIKQKHFHILCPKCLIKDFFVDYFYFQCDKCGWKQYNDADCKVCSDAWTTAIYAIRQGTPDRPTSLESLVRSYRRKTSHGN